MWPPWLPTGLVAARCATELDPCATNPRSILYSTSAISYYQPVRSLDSPGPSSQASLASMACGGDALAADERAPGGVAIWWLDGDSQVLDYDVTHV